MYRLFLVKLIITQEGVFLYFIFSDDNFSVYADDKDSYMTYNKGINLMFHSEKQIGKIELNPLIDDVIDKIIISMF